MKSSWAIIGGIAIIIIGAVVYFNHKQGNEAMPLKDLFKEEGQNKAGNIEYEIMPNTQTANVVQAPAMTSTIKETAPTAKTPVTKTAIQAPATVTSSQKYFTIQLASSKEEGQAKALLEKVKKQYPDAYLLTKDLGDKGVWHRLYVGKYKTIEEAKSVLAGLKKDYPQSFIVTTK